MAAPVGPPFTPWSSGHSMPALHAPTSVPLLLRPSQSPPLQHIRHYWLPPAPASTVVRPRLQGLLPLHRPALAAVLQQHGRRHAQRAQRRLQPHLAAQLPRQTHLSAALALAHLHRAWQQGSATHEACGMADAGTAATAAAATAAALHAPSPSCSCRLMLEVTSTQLVARGACQCAVPGPA